MPVLPRYLRQTPPQLDTLPYPLEQGRYSNIPSTFHCHGKIITAVPDVVAWVVSFALAVAVAALVSPLSIVEIVGAEPA
jgi:hypothetical protein